MIPTTNQKLWGPKTKVQLKVRLFLFPLKLSPNQSKNSYVYKDLNFYRQRRKLNVKRLVEILQVLWKRTSWKRLEWQAFGPLTDGVEAQF